MSIETVVLEALREKITYPRQLHELKIKYAEKFACAPPPNSEIINAYRLLLKEGRIQASRDFEGLMRKRAVRTLSGVSPVAVLAKPYKCPGACVFCPSEPDVPKSYLSNEPAVMRAIASKYDPRKQVERRIKTLNANGHPTDKIELIIMGGTWSFYPKQYQTAFVRGCLDAMNETKSRSLSRAQALNEHARHRCVAMTLETRPDWISEKEILRMRTLGATRVEIGVQSLYDDVLALTRRGHGIDAVVNATRLLKDAGFKISYHMMPNLPGSDLKRDIEMFKKLFADPVFRPDMLKVYPCVVVSCSELHQWCEDGRYEPYSDEDLIKLIFEIKPMFPPYLRVSRLIRDIPAQSITAGSKISNLRQIIHGKMKEKGIKCNCIRCREIRGKTVLPENIEFRKVDYEASGGREFFLSFDDAASDKICALLRLRFPACAQSGQKHFIKELRGAAVIRELHTYGAQVPISERDESASQHMGFGKKLAARAEEIARENGFGKIAVIAGVGVREYYKKLGYRLDGTYMVKEI